MHKLIADSFATDIQSALTAVNNDPDKAGRIFRELRKVLFENFHTNIHFITRGCSTSETVMMDKAYEVATKKIKDEFLQANKYSGWDLDNERFHRALDRLIYNIHHSLTYECPTLVEIFSSEPNENSDSYYFTRWSGKARYGLYVKVTQIDGTTEEFDLIETYNKL